MRKFEIAGVRVVALVAGVETLIGAESGCGFGAGVAPLRRVSLVSS